MAGGEREKGKDTSSHLPKSGRQTCWFPNSQTAGSSVKRIPVMMMLF